MLQSTSNRVPWTRRCLPPLVAVLALLLALPPAAVAKKPPPPPSACAFSTTTGQTTCVVVAPEVLDHTETPTLADVACDDANGDASTQTQSRTDSVYRTDTTTSVYQGRTQKLSTLVSTTTTSTYRTVVGAVTLGPCTDVTAPDTRLTGAPGGPTPSTTATFMFVSDEPGSTFECALDGPAYEPCTSPQTYSGVTPGTHSFSVRATDAEGNTDDSPAAWTWQVTAPPVVTITEAPADPTSSPLARFAFTSTQAGTFQCSLNGGPFSTCYSPYQQYVTAGTHTFTVKMTNSNGTDTDTRTWTVEATLPTCGAEVSGFRQLPDSTFEVTGTSLSCIQSIGHARVPSPQTCQGGGSYYNNPAFGNGSIYVRSWTDERVVFSDPSAAGSLSICLTIIAEYDGLEYPDAQYFDHDDFVAGPAAFNVTSTGEVGDGSRFTAVVEATSPALPEPFHGATLVADLTHEPLTGSSCVNANGTWRYETADGTLLRFVPMTGYQGRYCQQGSSNYYTFFSRVEPTEGDLLRSTAYNLSFWVTINPATGTFTTLHYGSLPYEQP